VDLPAVGTNTNDDKGTSTDGGVKYCSLICLNGSGPYWKGQPSVVVAKKLAHADREAKRCFELHGLGALQKGSRKANPINSPSLSSKKGADGKWKKLWDTV
jgi:hypothetical protein